MAPALAADPTPPRIVVTGEGEATMVPDLAILSLGVMREAATAREALDAGNAAMAAVIAAMKEGGVAERDLQTSGLSIQPRYTYNSKPDGTQEAVLVGYQVSNNLTVRLREIGKLGTLLDRAVTLGVNQGGSISFANADTKAAVREARKRAVEDAVDKAKTLAEAAGVEVGSVIEISDQIAGPSPMPITAKAYDRAEGVPVEAGENAYSVQVTVTFAIK